MKNTDLHIKILFLKCYSPLLKILVLENQWKLWCLYLVQHMLHQIKAPQFYTELGLQKTVFNPLANGKIQGIFKAFKCFQILFKTNFIFKDFSRQSCIFKYFSSLCEPCYKRVGYSMNMMWQSACLVIYSTMVYNLIATWFPFQLHNDMSGLRFNVDQDINFSLVR